MGQKGETHWWGDTLRLCGEHTLIYAGGGGEGAQYMEESTKLGYIGGNTHPSHSPQPPLQPLPTMENPVFPLC